MKSLLELIPHLNPAEGQYAFEVEVVGKNLPEQDDLMFHVAADGSLRGGGLEYVFQGPTSYLGAVRRLKHLYRRFKHSRLGVQEKAGVHTHINVQDWNVVQLFTFATLYYIVEDLLMEWCGDQRAGNHFCLRLSDAEYPLELLIKAAQKRNLAALNTEDLRYASLNFLSLFVHGSLEHRGMRTPTTVYPLVEWAGIIHQMVGASEGFVDPRDVVESMSMDGHKEFLSRVFGPALPSIERTIKDPESYLNKGVWMAQDLAYCRNWDELREVKKKGDNPFLKAYQQEKEQLYIF